MRHCFTLFLLVSLACSGPKAQQQPIAATSPAARQPPKAAAAPAVAMACTPTELVATIGPKSAGIAKWIGASGRFVVIDQFDDDPDLHNHHPTFSQHGGASGSDPVPHVYDVRATPAADWPVTQFVGHSNDDRWFAVRVGQTVQLVEEASGRRQALTDVDVEDDGNCWYGPRYLVFGVGQAAWIAKSRHHVVIRDLESGRERRVKNPEVIWRLQPWIAPNWITVLQVASKRPDADDALDGATQAWPMANSSCPCGWRARYGFASCGHYGWSGEFAAQTYDGHGRRRDADSEHDSPVTDGVAMRDGVLHTSTGKLDLKGCRVHMAQSRSGLLVSCPDGPRIVRDNGSIQTVDPMNILAVGGHDALDATGRPWLAVAARLGGRHFVGRMAMDNGQAELPLEVTGAVAADGTLGDWSVFEAGKQRVAIHAATGRQRILPARNDGPVVLWDLERGNWSETGRWRADPYSWEMPRFREGLRCLLAPKGVDVFEFGPWKLVCAGPAAK